MNKKIPIFFFTLVTMLCLGLVYGWSVFVVPLEAEFGWDRAETSIIFTISMSSMVFGIMVGGQFNKYKNRAFITLLIASILMLSGFILVSHADTRLEFYFFYGVLCGFGVGFAYVELIAVPTKWFPRRQGVLSGILMMCFGLGAMILGTICSTMMEAVGWRPTFVMLGILFGVLVFINGILLQITIDKKERYTYIEAEDNYNLTPKEMLNSTDFKLLYIWHIFISAAGLALMGHIAPCAIQMGSDTESAAIIAGIVSVSNGFGRILYGLLYDKLGVKKTLLTICTVFLIATILTAAAVSAESLSMLTASCVLVGISFGAAPTSSSAVVNKFYGSKYFSANFGIISTMLVAAALLGPTLAGKLYTVTGNYITTFYGIVGLGVISLFVILLTLKAAQKNHRKLN